MQGIGTVGPAEIAAIARDTFGAEARVESAEEITAIVHDGVIRRAGPSRNPSYVVRVAGVPDPLVFRFHGGVWEDRYDHEARCYEVLARHTGVRVPRIHRIDRSERIVPTAYMVLDYLRGEPWRYLTHPRNTRVTEAEKAEIGIRTGEFYARVHGITRPVAPGENEASRVRYMFERLQGAVLDGHFPVAPEKVERCLRAVDREPRFRNRVASLCLADTEIFFHREGGAWEIAFVCDTEWMEYRDPYSDLALVLAGSAELWELDEPLAPDPAELAVRPFFRGYEGLREVDPAELVHLTAYYQLGLWGNLLHVGPPEKREWIRAAKGELVRELVDRVGRRAERPAASTAR
ncbi:MAG TPA: phosphotransferase [Longimicrobiaceae bacterium]|nr:phosphotransferase [Longimicrobiaceae bacterium]